MKRILILMLACMATMLHAQDYLSPSALAWWKDKILIAETGANRLDIFDPAQDKVTQSILLPRQPNALCVQGDTAYVAMGALAGAVYAIDLNSGNTLLEYPAGHTPVAVAVVGDSLYIASRFADQVIQLPLAGNVFTPTRIARCSQPVGMAVDFNKNIWIANHLPTGPANGAQSAATLTVFVPNGLNREYSLANGSQGVRGIVASPDGKYMAVTHIVSRFHTPPTQLDRGWVNTNAVTIIANLDKNQPDMHTILLDDTNEGAANPWGVTFTPNGSKLIVTHAGTHELSIIDFPALVKKISEHKAKDAAVDQLGFLNNIRQRVPLPLNGPRCVLADNDTAYAAGYFSDNLAGATLAEFPETSSHALPAPAPRELTNEEAFLEQIAPKALRRKGEEHFNDASLCYQKWMSCASCHPDARVDALNWDLPNDGFGNPKNTRSMYLSHRRAPVMSLGIRKDAETAVKSGFIGFQCYSASDDELKAVNAYLKHMPVTPNPFCMGEPADDTPIIERAIARGQDACLQCHSAALQRRKPTDEGRKIFREAGCSSCHPHPYFTTCKTVDIGTTSGLDKGKPVVIPSLSEVWRTAPYFHDGSTGILREAIRQRSRTSKNGQDAELTEEQLDLLLQYVKSL